MQRLSFALLLLLGLAFIVAAAVPAPRPDRNDEKKIELVPIKVKDIVDRDIAGHKGKVVVVFFWAAYSPPSKAVLIEALELHKKCGEKGLVLMTVDVDYNERLRKHALKFLQDRKAFIANYRLVDGELDALQKHWNIESPDPAAVIYGRDGKVAKVFDLAVEAWTIKDIEKVVRKEVESR